MTDSDELIETRVISMRWEAENVLSVELSCPDADSLPSFEAGAHVDLVLPPDITRQYSLVNSQEERHRYVLAVALDPVSQGGSTYIHRAMRVGDLVRVSPPRNNFPLEEAASNTVLIAGGIGITPLLCMARRLDSLGRRWTLYLCARSRARAAFARQLAQENLSCGTVIEVYDEENDGRPIDLEAIFRGQPTGTHFYCCGPGPMLDNFESVGRSFVGATLHMERFKPRGSAGGSNSEFKVFLQRSGRSYTVPAHQSVLDVLLAEGEAITFSCRQGVCGACETAVVAGEPEHRDSILTNEERAANKTMMVCVSRCKSGPLALDL